MSTLIFVKAKFIYLPLMTTILLKLDPTTTISFTYKHFPQRLKKLHQNGISMKARTIKILESQELLQFENNQSTFSPNFKQKNKKKNLISTYMTYKKQQRNLRENHKKKLLHLKSKCLQSRFSSIKLMEGSNTSLTDSPAKPNSSSKSRLNLIVMSLNQTEVNKSKSRSKSRQFYIKTSQGKKQKVKTLDYQNKIMRRINESLKYDNQTMKRFNQYSKSSFIKTLNDSLLNNKRHSCNTLQRKFNIKNKANSFSNFNQEGSLEFRPWTSNKSELGQ